MKSIIDSSDKKNLKKKFNCPICSDVSLFIFTSKHARDIYECTNKDCGHFMTIPHMENQGIVPRYENVERLSDININIYGERNERLLKLLLNWLKNKNYPITFLDYGAGNAHVSRTFKKVLDTKVKIYCLEANPAFQDLYQKYGLIQIATPNELKEKIDFIYMIEVIEHLEDPIATMKQLRQSLNKNGSIFLSTPLGTRIENATNAYDTPSHLHFFSKKSFNLMLNKSGFTEIIFKHYSEMYPLTSNKYHKLKIAIKKLILNSFLKFLIPKKKVMHLVGLTRPINVKPIQSKPLEHS